MKCNTKLIILICLCCILIIAVVALSIVLAFTLNKENVTCNQLTTLKDTSSTSVSTNAISLTPITSSGTGLRYLKNLIS